MERIVECVPNISEGRRKDVIEAVVNEVRSTPNVMLLDYSSDESHNRSVITFMGEPAAVVDAAVKLAKKAAELIDLTKHTGEHPRMGAVVQLTLPVGSSIGLHTHTGNCEIIYVLSGSGRCIDDDAEYPITAGMCHYCPEGHTHSIVNTGETELKLLGVLPIVK